MSSLILQTTTRLIQPLFVMFSIFLLLRGHNAPGGGFVGGLMAAATFALHMIAYDVQQARQALRIDPRLLFAGGLLIAALSGMLGFFYGSPYLTSLWTVVYLGELGEVHLGTPLLFDLGVYLVVCGVTLMIVFSLAEE